MSTLRIDTKDLGGRAVPVDFRVGLNLDVEQRRKVLGKADRLNESGRKRRKRPTAHKATGHKA